MKDIKGKEVKSQAEWNARMAEVHMAQAKRLESACELIADLYEQIAELKKK
jgi:hypothetical protein